MENTASPKRGRPPGQANAPGHRAGRPAPRSATYPARLAHWRAWWVVRPGGKPSAVELAGRMEEADRTVRAFASGQREPSETALGNLESLSSAYGYQPLTADHQFL